MSGRHRHFEAPKSTPEAIAKEVERQRNARSKRSARARRARRRGPNRRNRSRAYE